MLRTRLAAAAPGLTRSVKPLVRAPVRFLGRPINIARAAVLALLGFAVAVRTIQFIANTSLSLDEAALALNILHRPSSRLLEQLDFNQGGPPVFLLAERWALEVFGTSEYALRSLSFGAGILAAFLVIPFLRRLFGRSEAVVLALALFVFSETLILYSATAKPYALDVLLTLILYIFALKVADDEGRLWIGIYAIIGAAAIWLSFAAVFILAGIGSTFVVRSALRHDWRVSGLHSLVGASWVGSFVALYFVSLRQVGHLQRSFERAFEFTFSADEERPGLAQTLAGATRSNLGIGHLDVWNHDLGRAVAVLAIALAVVGLATLLREKPVVAALLATPALFTVLASALGKYPLFARTLLFLVPATVAFIAYGVLRLATAARPIRSSGLAAMALVLAFITIPTVRDIAEPQRTSELKRALRYLANHQRLGDTLWVDQVTQYGLRYYMECECFGTGRTVRRGLALWPLRPAPGGADQFSPALKSVPPRFIVSKAVGFSSRYRSELSALRGRDRVWVLISDAEARMRMPLLSFLDRLGTREAAFRATSDETTAAVYLYDLGKSGRSAARKYELTEKAGYDV